MLWPAIGGIGIAILANTVLVWDQHSPTSAVGLLKESRRAGDQFLPDERCFFLFRLSSAAVHIDRRMAMAEADTMLQLTTQLAAGWNRDASQKNAVVAISAIDPDRALELLLTLQPPARGEELPEDLRSSAAEFVFPRYWRIHGLSALDRIQAAARHIGETGLYPFRAMALIILDVAVADPSTAQSLCNESLSYFRRPSNIIYANNFFVDHVEKVWPIMPQMTKQETIREVLNRLFESPKPPLQTIYKVWINTNTVELNNLHDVLLLELIPKIKETGFAATLAERKPLFRDLIKQSDLRIDLDDVMPVGSATRDRTSIGLLEKRAMDAHQIIEVRRLMKVDFGSAKRKALTLTRNSIRAQMLSEIAMEMLSHGQSSDARALLREAHNEITSSFDDPSKLEALGAFAEAECKAGYENTGKKAINEGYDLGQELFEQYIQTHPAAPHYDSDIVHALGKIGKVGLRYDSETTLSRIRHTDNVILRAYLLIEAAEALEAEAPE